MTATDVRVGDPRPRVSIRLEVALNALAVIVLPIVLRVLDPWLLSPLRDLGMPAIGDAMSGQPGWTDIAWEVVAARAIPEPGFSPYDQLTVIAHLIGLQPYDLGAHSHPPTSFVPFIPLGYVPYGLWLPFFLVISVGALAWSMRLMRVPAWVAYPLAIAVGMTPIGTFAATSTYPLMALLLALAWQSRDRPWVSGPAYALLAASRGVAGIMLLYPLVRRQWKTVVIAVAATVLLVAVAMIMQPDVVTDFLTRGFDAIAYHASTPTVFAVDAVFRRHGLPGWIPWLVLTAVAGYALWRRQNLFWVLAWFSIVLSPLAWGHSIVLALPLLVVIWQSGRLGQVLVLVAAAGTLLVLTQGPMSWNVSWLLMVATTTVAMLFCNLRDVEQATQPPTVSIPTRRTGAAL